MIILTQLIYIKDNKEDLFNQFEDIAIPIISRYDGNLMLRVRPSKESMIAGSVESPYEIHIVSFPAEKNFINYSRDKERQQFLHLKEASIRSTLLVSGKEVT